MNKRPFPPYILSRLSRVLPLSRLTSFPAFLASLSFLTFLLFPPFPPFPLFPQALASDEPFTYPSNRGGTGLMEIPTARVMKENSVRGGASQIGPYRYYYGVISPFKGLEIEGRITEILDVPSGLKNQKNFKDKAIDFKYQFISESKYIPAMALGFMDPHGTRIYPSQYIVASKQIYPFDFTLGFGNGRFGTKPLTDTSRDVKLEILTNTKSWLKDSQFFWGIQFAPSDKYALMVEYSPIKYHEQTRDPAQKKHFRDPVSSKFNFGIRYKPIKWAEIDLSYQRGEQIGVNVSMAFDIGNPLIPIYDRPYRETPSDELNPVSERLTKVLYKAGFSDIGIHIINNDIWIEAQNEKYFYTTRALGVIMKSLVKLLPENINNINIILKENGIPVIKFQTIRQDIIDLYAERMTLNEFLYMAQFKTDLNEMSRTGGSYKKLFRYGIKPDFQAFLNDPSGFFRYRVGFFGWASYHPWKGASLITGIATYPLNNISTSNEPLSIPVRSDLVLYKQEKVSLDRLMFDQVIRLTPKVLGKISTGLLEIQYAGIDAEVAVPVLNGRIFLGLGGSMVMKRDIDNPLEMKRDDVKDIYTTAFFKTRLNIPEEEIAIDLKAGRFLAGDNGIRFTVYKHIKGVTLWAWYSFTDTSVFSDRFNKDYHEKGIGISIPIRLFKGTDSRTAYTQSISPWARDVAQDIDHFISLFDVIGRNSKIYIDKDKKLLFR